uniref:Secreted protein n=1 Tax=Romanomermis culicivorax TaxID=13658 RepID=A0A915IJN1_ROMCU
MIPILLFSAAFVTAAVQAAPWTTMQPWQTMKFPQPTWNMPSPVAFPTWPQQQVSNNMKTNSQLAPFDFANWRSSFSNNGSPTNVGKSSSSSKCDSTGCTVCIN